MRPYKTSFMLKNLYLACLLLITPGTNAATPEDSAAIYQENMEHYVDSIKKAQKYQTGTILLPGGKAAIQVPAGFKFLNKEQSRYVLTTLWGNPPENAANTLGMIFPEKADPFTDSSYAFIVEFEEIGYVKDDDAEKIDYDEMLKNMQAEEKEDNKERLKQGYPELHFIGWAQQPYYDKQNKVLHWAKEIRFGDDDGDHTLNYEVRILGRHGVLSMNAVCTMRELPLVKANINKVLHMASFTDGNTYADFDPKIDNIAAWTIGGLVAGKVLAKVGFFGIILKFLGVAWKFIALAFIALFAYLRRVFFRRKEEKAIALHSSETEPEPVTAAEQAAPADTDENKPTA